MTLRTYLPLATVAVSAAVLSVATGAKAADPPVRITGAYAFLDTSYADGATTAVAVFRTAAELPRRADGMIQAVGALDGTNASLGAVKHRQGSTRHCYQVLVRLKDGRLPRGGKASAGTKHQLTVALRDGSAQATRTVTLVKAAPGYRSGQPLGC